MTRARLPWYALAIFVVLLAGYGLAVLGLTLCSPAPLTGDDAWVWSMRLSEAFRIIFGREAACFYVETSLFGDWSLYLASWGGWVALVVAVAAVLWETVGREVRNELRCKRGGHVILAGEPEEVEPLAAVASSTKSV